MHLARAASRLHRSLRALALAAVVPLAACSQETPIALFVISPDGGDPFLEPDAATHARITLEDDASAPQVVPVGARGEFRFDIRPPDPNVTARVRVEALRNERVIGAGVTPAVRWQQRGGNIAAVLVQRCGSIVPAPFNLGAPRSNFELVPAGDTAVAAVTLAANDPAPAGGQTVDVYDFLLHSRRPMLQMVPADFDGATAVVPIYKAWLLVRGGSTAIYTGNGAMPIVRDMPPPPRERGPLLDSTVLPDVANSYLGGWLVGGRDAATLQPSDRVDHVLGDGAWDTPPPRLRHPRARPQVVQLRPALPAAPATWLLVGGQASGTLLEVYNPGSPDASRDVSIASSDPAVDLDGRVGVAALCVAETAQGCSRVMLVGGRRRNGEPAEDVLLDADCLRRFGDGCMPVLARGTWVSRRRVNARVALADRTAVLVVGGRDPSDLAGGAVFEAEAIDVSTPDTPRPAGVVATLPNADPAVLALPNGNVVIAGGTDRDNAPRTEVWFYRHCP